MMDHGSVQPIRKPRRKTEMAHHLIRSLLGAAALGATLLSAPASAANITFTGSGTWDADAPTSLLSAPGAGWSFSFEMPEFVAPNPSTAIGSFAYMLSGSPLAVMPLSIEFYSPADSGGFDIAFGSDLPTLSIYSDALLLGGTLQQGTYEVFSGIDGGVTSGAGTIQLQAVPEPATAVSLVLGISLVSLATRRRRRPSEAMLAPAG